jgi:HSP20 family protein
MVLVRYQPFGGRPSHRDEVNRLFEGFFDRPEAGREAGQEVTLYPAVDLLEESGHYTISAELPGLKAEDVKITLADNVLTVEGEKKEERERKGRNYHRVERSQGRFRRSFSLPGGVRADRVKAAARDGVLTITVPKAEEAVAREIEVESA